MQQRHLSVLGFIPYLILTLFFNSCKEQRSPELIVTPVKQWPTSLGFECSFIPMIGQINTYTLTYSKDQLKYGDTIHSRFQGFIKYDLDLEIEEVETILRKEGFSDIQLREHIFWLCKLSKAYAIELSNQFGDSRGYMLVADDIEIPSEYYTVKEYGRWNANNIVLAERQYPDGSSIKYYLNLAGNEIYESNITTPIHLNPSIYLLRSPYTLMLGIEVVSVLHTIWADKHCESYLTGYYKETFCFDIIQSMK